MAWRFVPWRLLGMESDVRTEQNMAAAYPTLIWPGIVYGGIVVLMIAAVLVISYLLGERHTPPGRNVPYESGVQPVGSARIRYDARYYLVGVFFILFDIEAAIVLTWAVAFRELGWLGYTAATLFVVTLAVGLVYIWRMGGLDYWRPNYDMQDRGEDDE